MPKIILKKDEMFSSPSGYTVRIYYRSQANELLCSDSKRLTFAEAEKLVTEYSIVADRAEIFSSELAAKRKTWKNARLVKVPS